MRLSARADRSPEKRLPMPRRLLALQPHDESVLRRGANRPPLSLPDRPAAGRDPGRAGGPRSSRETEPIGRSVVSA